jgi:hypothetical protein
VKECLKFISVLSVYSVAARGVRLRRTISHGGHGRHGIHGRRSDELFFDSSICFRGSTTPNFGSMLNLKNAKHQTQNAKPI